MIANGLEEQSVHPWVLISEFLYFQEGPGVRKTQYTETGVKLLNGSNINENKLKLDNTDRYVSEKEAQGRYSHFLVDAGDLLIASSGISVDKFDKKIAYAEAEDLPLCMNTSTIRFKSMKPDKLDLNYFRWFLGTNLFKGQLGRLITGSAQLNFGPSHLKQMYFPLPPLEEQRRIAAILDKADAIARKRKKAIALTDTLLKSVFLDMFGDPVTNPMGWEVVEISQLCSQIVDCVNRTAPIVEYTTPFKMIRTTNVRNHQIDTKNVRYVDEKVYLKWVRRLKPKFGDVIFTREAPAGEAGIIETNEHVFCGQRTMHFRPNENEITPEYLLFELMSEGIGR